MQYYLWQQFIPACTGMLCSSSMQPRKNDRYEVPFQWDSWSYDEHYRAAWPGHPSPGSRGSSCRRPRSHPTDLWNDVETERKGILDIGSFSSHLSPSSLSSTRTEVSNNPEYSVRVSSSQALNYHLRYPRPASSQVCKNREINHPLSGIGFHPAMQKSIIAQRGMKACLDCRIWV